MTNKKLYLYSFLLLINLLFSSLVSVFPMKPFKGNDNKVQAQNIINRARKAIYGSLPVQGLSLTWKNQMYYKLAGKQDSSESNIDLLLPDKFLFKEVRDFSGNSGQMTTFRFLNGNHSWEDIRSSSSEHLVMKSPVAEDSAKRLQGIRRAQALQLLQLMLPVSSDFPLTFSYSGEAKANDGQAYVINVRGPDAFSAQIFIDKITSRPLMMIYIVQGATGLTINSRDLKKGGAGNATLSQIEIKIRFLEYKLEDGVTLPHLITQEQNGMITKEAELRKFKLNPNFAPDHFDLNKKRK